MRMAVRGIQNIRRRSGDRAIESQRRLNLDEPITRWPDDPMFSVGVLAVDRPDLCRVLFQRIEMHHPVEDYGKKFPAVGVAFFLGDDGSLQAELRIRG